MYEMDERVRVPDVVFNAVRGTEDQVSTGG
jgi:hypothetical protein